MKKEFKFFIENDDIGEITIKSTENPVLEDVLKEVFKEDYRKYLGARINNTVYNLRKKVEDGMKIKFFNLEDEDGYKIFIRTITAIYVRACKYVFPGKKMKIEHSLGAGLYTYFEDGYGIGFKDLEEIKEKMQEIIDEDHPIVRQRHTRQEAISIFENLGCQDKVRLYKTLDHKEFISIYTIDGFRDAYHGYLAPSTGYIHDFDLKFYYPGAIILFPTKSSPDSVPEYKELGQLATVYDESKKWAKILGLGYLGILNEKAKNGDIYETIRISEALQEKKIGKIADEISEKRDVNMILIAGPSSSGKTTFANRLAVHLKVNGKEPIVISVDDYFVNREHTPLKEDGSYDFESIDAIALDVLNRDLIALLEGKEVELPKFDFVEGKRKPSGNIIKVNEDYPIILEGIHGLNPKLTELIPNKNKYKIYISALTQLNLDAHNRVSTADTRLIRRMVRDNKFRGNDIYKTLDLWSNVRKGEEKYIFEYQEEADVMFDSSLLYELAMLKKHIVPLLEEIDQDNEHYGEAKRLLGFLDYFISIEDESSVPPNSILREFIGGSDKFVH